MKNPVKKPADLLKVIPRPYDFGDGTTPTRPAWVRYVRESDLRDALQHHRQRIPTYTPDGERHRDVAMRQPTAKRQELYEERHNHGMMHRCHLGPGAIITPA